MPLAYAFILSGVGASFTAAFLGLILCSMPDAHSTGSCLICTSFAAASLYLCTVPDAYSSSSYLICTSLKAASLDLCTVPDAYSSSSCLIWHFHFKNSGIYLSLHLIEAT
eukprot:scaffold1487_cov130-Skeletonema_marinoi.AAC.5